MISITNLTKKYGHFTALDNINLEVSNGDILGLLGPNGAGKTSLMRVISGFMAAEEGHCFVNGYEVHKDPLKAQAYIGYLPEQPPLYPEMRVSDYLKFVANIKGMPRSDFKKRLDYVLEAVILQDRRHQIIKTLSKGYKQRVGIAMALIHDPKLLILDEPTVGLDPNQILEIRSLIKKLAKDRTVVISSHILPEIASSCNRIVIISEGKIVVKDSTDNLSSLAGGARAIKVVSKDIKEKKSQLVKEFDLEKIEFPRADTAILYKKDLHFIAHQIPKFLVKAGIDFTEYAPYQQSLEDVFRKLTLKDSL